MDHTRRYRDEFGIRAVNTVEPRAGAASAAVMARVRAMPGVRRHRTWNNIVCGPLRAGSR